MKFSPILTSSLIINPLRYFFATYTSQYGFLWDPNEKISTMEIGSVNDFNEIPLQQKPRILVNRGTYVLSKAGLSDNRLDGKDLFATGGLDNKKNTIWINGQASITIETTNEGTCEMLTDMVSVFLVWARPLICSTQGFNELGLPMQISECVVNREDREKFTATLTFPYVVEQQWRVDLDPIKFKSMLVNLTSPPVAGPTPGSTEQITTSISLP